MRFWEGEKAWLNLPLHSNSRTRQPRANMRVTKACTNSLFMCQVEDEDEHQSFGSFWNLWMMNKPILQCITVLRAWFVCHRLYPEGTKTFVFVFVLVRAWFVCHRLYPEGTKTFVFVFVLAHEQPINTGYTYHAGLRRLQAIKTAVFRTFEGNFQQ